MLRKLFPDSPRRGGPCTRRPMSSGHHFCIRLPYEDCSLWDFVATLRYPAPPAEETMIGINLAAQAFSRFPSPGWPLHQVANVRSTLWLLYPAHYESLLSSGWIQKASRLCDRLPGAERSGFEPEIRFCRIHAFQACLLSHSSISPVCIPCVSDQSQIRNGVQR